MKNLVPWRQGQKHAALISRNNRFDRWWNDPFNNFLPERSQPFSTHMPSVDVSEDKKEVRVRAELPGMTEKDIQLTWKDGTLCIRGEKSDEKEEKGKDRYYRECSYGSFIRNIPLGNNVDWKKATAKYRNGVLTVMLPKTGENKRIDVEIS